MESRRGATALAASVAAMLLAGCPSRPAPASPTQQIVIATGADFAGVNELVQGGSRFSQEVRGQLFRRLLEEQPAAGSAAAQFEPALAESWTFSADHRELTMVLAGDASWSDGAPVTAQDVRWTWLAQTDPELAWSASFIKERIEDVVAVDEKTVRFVFDSAYRTQLFDANEGFVLPRRQWQSTPFGSWRQDLRIFEQELVVSGPFTLAGWIPQQELTLVPSAPPAGPRPTLERVTFRVLPDQAAQIRQLRSGEVDVVLFVPPAEAAALDADPAIQLHAYPANQYTYIGWNLDRPLFADAAIRRALTQAIDREALVETLWYGRARVGVSPIPAESWAFARELTPWPYDPQGAREALAAAGWVDADADGVLDRDGKPFRFELLSNTGNQTRHDAGVMIQAQLAAIGVAVELREVELNSLISLNESGEYDGAIGAWGIDTSLDLRYAFHSDEIAEGSNFVRYRNAEVDALLDELRDSLEPTRTRELLVRVQELLHQDQPYTFLWEPQGLVASRSRVEGVAPTSLGIFRNLAEWRVTAP